MTTKRPEGSKPESKTTKMVDSKTIKMVDTGGFTHGYKPSSSAPARPAVKPPAPPSGSGGGSSK